MSTLPSYDQIEYQARRLRDRQARTLGRLLRGEHIEKVAHLVASYYPDDPGDHQPTADDVAHEILHWLSINVIEPLLAEPPVEASGG